MSSNASQRAREALFTPGMILMVAFVFTVASNFWLAIAMLVIGTLLVMAS